MNWSDVSFIECWLLGVGISGRRNKENHVQTLND